jgi:hypothetical protein
MTEEQAKKRFILLNLVRFSGLLIALAGIANVGRKLAPDLAPGLGLALLVMGMIDFFFAPMLLKRAWQNEGK